MGKTEDSSAGELKSVVTGHAASKAVTKGLSLTDGIVFVLGCTVGSGLFFAPGDVANVVQSPCGSLLAWMIAACLSLAGALCYSELGTTFVSAGAEAYYFKKAFGPETSFAFSWTMFLVIGSGACCCIAVVLGEYVSLIFTETPDWLVVRCIAIAALCFLCGVNLVNPNYVNLLNRVNLFFKIAAVLIVVIGGLIYIAVGGGLNTDVFMSQSCWAGTNWAQMGQGVMFALFAFSGWHMLNPLTEDLDNPERDVPRIYIAGMSATTLIAVLVNIGFFVVLPLAIMSSKLAGPFAMTLIPGSGILRIVLCIFVSFCCLGSCNGMLLGTSKIIASAGSSRILPGVFGKTFGAHDMPFVSVISFTIWTVILVVALPSISVAVTFYTVGQWFFFILVALSVLVLRHKFPKVNRPYEVHMYPYLPVAFILTSIAILGMTLADPDQQAYSIGGFGIIVIGYVMYYVRDLCRSDEAKQVEAGAACKEASPSVELGSIGTTSK